MSYKCKILLDSISPTGKRITTMEVTFPRCVLAEAETHRVLRGFGGNIEELVIHNLGINIDENLSRNSASSRAIPINKMLQRVKENPFIPEKWGMPVKGMGTKEYYDVGTKEHNTLTELWNRALLRNIEIVEDAINIGNKEDLNRLLEPFMWHTVIITATEFSNFFKLRCDENAQYEIRRIADLMYEAYHAYDDQWINPSNAVVKFDCPNKEWLAIKPQKLKVGEWHCPLVYKEDEIAILHYVSQQDTENGEYQRKTQYKNFKSPEIGSLDNGSDEELYNELIDIKKKISVARCARVSYLTHDGKRDIKEDLGLFKKLVIRNKEDNNPKHMSPTEHVATPYFREGQIVDVDNSTFQGKEDLRSGNFIGWKAYRKEFADENCINFRK